MESGSARAALIRMPTGTGKSGVIATLALCFEDTGSVLLVTPWKALRSQLADDVSGRFWHHIGVDHTAWEKSVVEFTPSSLQDALEAAADSPTVFVTTIQTLQTVYRKTPETFAKLSQKLDLAMVDEGHREPAPEWAKAVRSLATRTALFTATPYRNDYKVFDIDRRHVYAYTHEAAVKDRYIREVTFKQTDLDQSPEGFVSGLLYFYHGEFQDRKPKGVDTPRVIVRCESYEDVKAIAKKLEAKGEPVIAVHDQFPIKRQGSLCQRVPKPDETDALFWIHQRKLIEGIDDPAFSLLAIYQPFRNARELVQQIGRVLRNPKRFRGQQACVMTDPKHNQQAFWEGYREYERRFEERPDLYEPRQFFDVIVSMHPSYDYREGAFRARFNIESSDVHMDFEYLLITNVFEVGRGFTIPKLETAIRREWKEDDLDIRQTTSPSSTIRVHAYVVAGNSPVLREHSLVEYRVAFTIYWCSGRLLFYYDSEGNTPRYLNTNARRLDPARLEKLYDSNARFSQVTLMNSDLGRHSVRTKTVRAYSIADTAPGLVDHSHFCSRTEGFTRNDKNTRIRRYIGFRRARISDSSAAPQDFCGYVGWLKSVKKALTGRGASVPRVLRRYARFTEPPDDPTPVNILLDTQDIQSAFETAKPNDSGEYETLMIEDVCCDIENGAFTCKANTREYRVGIEYVPNQRRYRLRSSELNHAYLRQQESPGRRRGLVAHLNAAQAFRVVPSSAGTVYAHGHFYSPRLKIAGRGHKDLDLLRVLHPVPHLDSVTSEKGSACPDNGSGWEAGSVFHLLDNLGSGTELQEHMEGTDILVCDDMCNECADFIAGSTERNWVAFIHAKVPSKRRIKSASVFSEVCSQAVKNLDYIIPHSGRKPANFAGWNAGWKAGGVAGVVHKRIRRPKGGKAKETWDSLSSLIRDPSSSREVWIVLGRGFSYEAFNKERNRDKPRPEMFQILYMLGSTWDAVSQAGAALKIFCSP